MTRTPAVSVVMPAYNHAAFIVEAIESVLSQDFDDLELIVSDDGSRDDTVERARSVTDSRLRVIDNRLNRGAAIIHNELIANARGRYVAVINSDDAWTPGKLSKQVAFLESHPDAGACFGRARFIDSDGADIPPGSLSFGSVFDVDNRSRGAWLRHFLLRGNCLCHPTLLIRREVYGHLGPYDNRLRQLPDFDMWIRLVSHTAFYVFPDTFIRFRILPGENASANTAANAARTLNEHYFIARRFFDHVSPDLLREGFSDLLVQPQLPTQEHLDIEKAFLFLQPMPALGAVYRTVALTMLHDLLASDAHRLVLARDYDFDDRSLHRMASEAMPFAQMAPRDEIEAIQQELAAMRASTSWRVTEPIRRLMRLIPGS